MKKLLSALLSATLLASFAVMPVSAAADVDKTYGSWSTRSRSEMTEASVSLVTNEDVGVEGVNIDGHAIKLSVAYNTAGTGYGNTYAYVWYQPTNYTITKGQKYKLSGKMYVNRADQNAFVASRIDAGGSYRIGNLGPILDSNFTQNTDPNPGWKSFSYEFTHPYQDNCIAFGLVASGTVILDDLSLVAVTEENGVTRYSEELLSDGDFESEYVDNEDGNHYLTGVTGWTDSFYNLPDKSRTAGIELLENVIDTPEGNHMLKIWAGPETNTLYLNANARQHIQNLDKEKTYVLTGWVKYNTNNTKVSVGNATFIDTSTSVKSLQEAYGSANNGKWVQIKEVFKPTNAAVELQFTCTGNRSIYLDDLAVREVETVDGVERLGENLLVNGGFEDDYAIYETGNHTLSGVPGWTKSNWNVVSAEYPAGVTLLENLAGAPKGGNVLKVWAGGITNLDGHNAHAIQILNGLDKAKTYRLTGSVKHSSNNTAVYLGNTSFNDGKEKSLREHFGGQDSDGKWNTLSIDFTPNDSNNIELRFTASANRSIWLNGLSVKEVLSDGSLGEVEYLKNGTFTAATVTNPVLKAETVFYPAQQEDNGYSIMDKETALEALSDLSETYETNSICALTTVENTTEVAEKVYTYLAVYDGETLKGVVVGSTTVESSEDKEEISTYYTLPDDKTGLTLKLFAWDASMKPLGVNGEIK